MSIQKTIFAGIRWTGLSSVLGLVLGLLQVAVLARYLEKSDFAWVAIAGVFVNIGIQLQQSSINTAIVQQPHLSKVQLSTAYWLNIIIGLCIFLIASILAFFLRWVYASPILFSIFIIYSVIFLIQAFTVQYKALLQKNFHFQALSIGESLGIIISFVFAVIAAVKGLGAYALVGSYVMRYIIEAIFIILLGRRQFTPVFEWNWKSIQPLLHFGGWHMSERLITHFSSQIDILLIGKLLGSEALGAYDVFKRILVRPFNLLNDIFEKVTFPVFSKFQEDHTLQKKMYLDLLAYQGAVNFPLLAFLAFAATPVVQLLFGAQWLEGVPVFQLLCLFCFFHYLLNPVDTLLLSVGKIRLWLLANLLFIPLQFIFLILGSQFDLIKVTLANVIAYFLFTLSTYFLIVLPEIKSNIMELTIRLVRPLFLTLLALLFLLPFASFFSQKVTLIPMAILFSILYFMLTMYYNRAFFTLIRKFFYLNYKK